MSEINLIKKLIILSLAVCLIIPLGGCGKSNNELYMELSQEYPDTDLEISADSQDTMTLVDVDNESIYVYVCGAVARPGVYELGKGSRLYEAVDMAGGMSDDADKTYLNMARELTDGEQVVVYTESEVESLKEQAIVEQSIAAEEKSGLVNINTADISELVTLSGIGQSRAEAIIDYREKNGAFGSIEDIKNVDGIKDGLFSKIKDKITV
jgi:competence protein ComEA